MIQWVSLMLFKYCDIVSYNGILLRIYSFEDTWLSLEGTFLLCRLFWWKYLFVRNASNQPYQLSFVVVASENICQTHWTCVNNDDNFHNCMFYHMHLMIHLMMVKWKIVYRKYTFYCTDKWNMDNIDCILISLRSLHLFLL